MTNCAHRMKLTKGSNGWPSNTQPSQKSAKMKVWAAQPKCETEERSHYHVSFWLSFPTGSLQRQRGMTFRSLPSFMNCPHTAVTASTEILPSLACEFIPLSVFYSWRPFAGNLNANFKHLLAFTCNRCKVNAAGQQWFNGSRDADGKITVTFTCGWDTTLSCPFFLS